MDLQIWGVHTHVELEVGISQDWASIYTFLPGPSKYQEQGYCRFACWLVRGVS